MIIFVSDIKKCNFEVNAALWYKYSIRNAKNLIDKIWFCELALTQP